MQTFLPLPSFEDTMHVLDNKRLGNQVYNEGATLLKGKWPNHPASKMWKGYEHSLATYCLAGVGEMANRGNWKDEVIERWYHHFTNAQLDLVDTGLPPWFGDEKFHDSHKSNLVRKLPEHYKELWPDIANDLPYVWPKP